MGRPRLYTDEQRREMRRIKSAAWRAANPDRSREIGRDSMRRATAEKAIADGREPGRVGRPAIFTEEQKREKRRLKAIKYYRDNIDSERMRAAKSMQRTRDKIKQGGAPLPNAWNKLTDEQRKERDVVFSHKRRARIKQVGGTFTAADIDHLMKRQNGVCVLPSVLRRRETAHRPLHAARVGWVKRPNEPASFASDLQSEQGR